MSWDASFDGRDWNYTHNTNRMIAAAYKAATGEDADQDTGPLELVAAIGPAWWKRLDGMSGMEGGRYLGKILAGLCADPDRYRAMNPDNGWGDYDSLLRVLQEMCAHSLAACCDKRRWEVWG